MKICLAGNSVSSFTIAGKKKNSFVDVVVLQYIQYEILIWKPIIL